MNARLIVGVVMLFATGTSLPLFAEVGQKRTRCAEGIGCADEKKQAPEAPKLAPRDGKNMKAQSPGLGKGIMELPPGSPYDQVRTPAELAFSNEMCRASQQRADGTLRELSNYTYAPELAASDCIELGKRNSTFGPGFHNKCPQRVMFAYCVENPEPESWEASFDCNKQQFGTVDLHGLRDEAAHTNGTIHWAGCRFPEGSMADTKFVRGKGIVFNCKAWKSDRVREALHKNPGPACEADEVAREASAREEIERLAAKIPEILLAEKQEKERIAQQRALEAQRAQQALQAQQAPPPAYVPARPPAPRPSSPRAPTGDCTATEDICNDLRKGLKPGTTRCLQTGGRNCFGR